MEINIDVKNQETKSHISHSIYVRDRYSEIWIAYKAPFCRGEKVSINQTVSLKLSVYKGELHFGTAERRFLKVEFIQSRLYNCTTVLLPYYSLYYGILRFFLI